MNNPPDCNGWSNYETWAVNLWLTDDEARLHRCRALANEANTLGFCCAQVLDKTWAPEEARIFLLADRLKELVEKHNPLAARPSMFADLLAAALEAVNWNEIAREFLGISSPEGE